MAKIHEIGWSLVPPAILAAEDLNAAQKLLWGRIYSLVGKEGYCWANNEWLGKQLKLKARTVETYIQDMVRKGYLRREYGPNGKRNRRLYPLIPSTGQEPIPSRSLSGSHPENNREAIPKIIGNVKKQYIDKEHIEKRNNILSGSPEKANPTPSPNGFRETAKELLQYLNQVAERRFQPTDKNLGLIAARLKENFSEDDIRLVVDFKVAEWGSDPKMAQYVRPDTLFRPSKFPGYLAAARLWDQQGRPPFNGHKSKFESSIYYQAGVHFETERGPEYYERVIEERQKKHSCRNEKEDRNG